MSVTEPPSEVRVPAAEYESLKATVKKLREENALLSEELKTLLDRIFRKKSERLDPNQLRLFAEELQQAVESQSEEPGAEEQEKKPRKKSTGDGHGRSPFPDHLPREEIQLDVPEEERVCSDCGQGLHLVGEEVTERGRIIPARMMVMRYVRKKYGCPTGHGIRTPDLPPTVVEKGKYEASTYAHLAVAKYGDHVPLNRLEGIYKRHGFRLSRSTMWDMLDRTDELVAQPILKQMRSELLNEPLLHADETPTTVLLEDNQGSKKAYIWCYGVGRKWIFDFTMTRGRDGPRNVLGSWKGTMITDGYSGYDEIVRLNGIVRGGCWSHARRKLKDALDAGVSEAIPLMRDVQRLFWLERAVKRRAEARQLDESTTLDLRRTVRQRRSARLVKQVQDRSLDLLSRRSTIPKSVLGKAVKYLANQSGELARFLENPAMPIHNNDAERALRHIVVGRKNWLFFGSPRGAKVGANLFSLIATCKALGLNPEAYLEDVLMRVDTTPSSEIARLTPWAWAAEHPQHLVN